MNAKIIIEFFSHTLWRGELKFFFIKVILKELAGFNGEKKIYMVRKLQIKIEDNMSVANLRIINR